MSPDRTIPQATAPSTDHPAADSERAEAFSPTEHIRTIPQAVPPAPLPAVAARAGRFVLGEELARGGMGVVYRATDPQFGREVAVKVVQTTAPGLVRRFVEEAKITGQLQHPGIPPVYEVGELADDQPYLAMKLIKGDTLDALVRAGADRGRLLPVFEGICQAVGYAHAHNVIHRDLKPSNVMVGAFGEVQVMDWGLAKVLASGGVQPRRPDDDPDATTAGTVIHSAREDTDHTQAGSLLGTPAYMAPEQAGGFVHRIDRRTDVFALGGLLCFLLTGEPPYVGGSSESTWEMAARADLPDAVARLGGCGADPDLVALCKRCLAADPADRPADGAAVATEVAALRAAADERARRAEVDRARAEVQAAEERKRQQVERQAVADRLAAEQRRRRTVLRYGGALVAVLLLGVAAAISGLLWAVAAHRDTSSAESNAGLLRIRTGEAQKEEAKLRKKAEEHTQLADAVKDFLRSDVLNLPDPLKRTKNGKPPGDQPFDAEVTLRDVVLRAAKALDGKFTEHPLVEAELRWTIGLALEKINRPDLAMGQHERVRAILVERLDRDNLDTFINVERQGRCFFSYGLRGSGLLIGAVVA